MYDVNANPDGLTLSMSIDEIDNSLSLDLAISTAIYYGISKDDARNMASSITEVVEQNWIKLARENKISESSINYMKKAFVGK